MLTHFLRATLSNVSTPILVGSAFSDTSGINVSSYSQAVPSGNVNDCLIFIFGSNSAFTAFTPSGWTSLGTSSRSAIFYKTATTTSEADFTVSPATTAIFGGVVLRFKDASQTPVLGTYATATIAGPSTLTATAVSATLGDYVLQVVVDGGAQKTFSQPTVSNATIFSDTNTVQPSIFVFNQISGSTNATTTKTGTSSVVNFVQLRLRK